MTEKQIENQILTYLACVRIFCFKNQSVGVFDPTRGVFRKTSNPHHIAGTSDILGIYEGRFLAIEVKRPTISKKTLKIKHKTQEEIEKMASKDQVAFINKIKYCGGIAFYADSIDVLKEQLELWRVKVYR